ncbi:DUF4097 family beta strand repeat-containing protein [Thermococcus gammatolerans]|uniref:DUF4097 domain-containing protein n=1 Tax=Thermococcus gammatolerans (strain DSM 15229 / JCM 11827 / EJ3) TaxID=593117 RepID=C5A6J9_THEGJ|nr:DUF4097 family beta strand repeat-containing protein [Thermococcus gammatolerans]ACS33861.1 Conserved hypothetical protein [Thermococcus gammatolerans EJ3]
MLFEDVREVHLNFVNGRVNVSAWDEDAVKVSYTKHGEVDLIVENMGGKLVINEKPRRKFRFLGIIKAEEGWVEMELKVPRGVPVNARNVNGELIAEGVRFTEVTTVNGEITLRNCEAELMKSVNGEIDAHLRVAGPLEVSTVNGDITVTIEELEGDVNVNCVNGDVTIRLTEFCDARIEAKKVNSDVELIGIPDGIIGTGEFPIRIKTVNGDVRVEII